MKTRGANEFWSTAKSVRLELSQPEPSQQGECVQGFGRIFALLVLLVAVAMMFFSVSRSLVVDRF
ncbi:hypothetical protein [Polaromonas sp. UBA4122]|uniref:hypothetical protein n=1 Tax=Polaromonas sp. UBA4122 TaxID=1947074 RepID=UPI0025E496BA|nr:hypothetical protein [Polaromonas sp. UBA4122]